jgi:hypothetical protein
MLSFEQVDVLFKAFWLLLISFCGCIVLAFLLYSYYVQFLIKIFVFCKKILTRFLQSCDLSGSWPSALMDINVFLLPLA